MMLVVRLVTVLEVTEFLLRYAEAECMMSMHEAEWIVGISVCVDPHLCLLYIRIARWIA